MNKDYAPIFDIRQHEIDTLKKIDKLLMKGNFKAVIKEAAAARVRYPNNLFFYTMESIAQSTLGNSEKALKLLQIAENKFPDSYEVHFHLAKVYEDLEDYEKAEASYKKSYDTSPAEYPEERSDCLNDLGVLYWKLLRREEALENWKLALLEYPRNTKAKRNLRHFTNEYNEPKADLPLMDDINHFRNIQLEKYFTANNKNGFSNIEEVNKVLQLIGDAWNKHIVADMERLDTSSAEVKTKWFESIEIDFNGTPMTNEDKSKLFGGPESKKGGETTSKKKKRKMSKEEKELEEFKSKFPFLPEDGFLFITIASPFLVKAGLELERFEEILKEGTDDEDEIEMLLWAYDIGNTLFESVMSDDDEEAKEILNIAFDIAGEILEEEEIKNALEVTLKAIQEFGKELE